MGNKKIAIVGAGIAGLSAAIRLAAAGHDVTIYEQNAEVGGKMAEYCTDQFRWDTGPSVITMRHVFEELFASANRQLSDYLTFLPVDPLTRYFYPDGTQIDITRDWQLLAEQIAALDERDVAGYLRFLQKSAEIHRITSPTFIYSQPPTVRSFLNVPLRDWFKIDALRTMQQSIESSVHSPQLRQLLGRFATYVGGSPYAAPATLNVIAHVELTGGVWYPQGGVYQIAHAMCRLAQELGVTIRCNTTVAQIALNNSKASGLTLADGQTVSADFIISNLDVTTTYEKLLSAQRNARWHRSTLRRLKRQEPSCSGFIVLLGIKGEHPELAHHNIWFSDNYSAEFDAIFKQGVPAQNPTVYAAITSKTDPDHAPVGHENWFILVNAPALNSNFDWKNGAIEYRNRVLNQLATHGIDLRGKIVHERIMTPYDLMQNSGAHRGALYGASANSRWTAFRRPHNRCPDVPRLYFAGGTTHPGGGVPMVTLSGKVAADFILQDS